MGSLSVSENIKKIEEEIAALQRNANEILLKTDRGILILQGRLEVFKNLQDCGIEVISLPQDQIIEEYSASTLDQSSR